MTLNRGWKNVIAILCACKKQKESTLISHIFRISVTGNSTNLHLIHLLVILVVSLQSRMGMYLMEELFPRITFKLLWSSHAKCLVKSGT
jgi:hypothetical protein